jgi:hypothetical protein
MIVSLHIRYIALKVNEIACVVPCPLPLLLLCSDENVGDEAKASVMRAVDPARGVSATYKATASRHTPDSRAFSNTSWPQKLWLGTAHPS